MDFIHIHDLHLKCIVGVYEHERRENQDIILSVSLGLNLRGAGESDNLEHTVDYKKLQDEIIALVTDSRFQLIESIAESVATLCLKHNKVQLAKIVVEKPAALRFVRTVAIEITRSRS